MKRTGTITSHQPHEPNAARWACAWGGFSPLRMYCIVLYCIVLYCIVLYCIVLYCIVLYCIVLYCIVLYLTMVYFARPPPPGLKAWLIPSCKPINRLLCNHPSSAFYDVVLRLLTAPWSCANGAAFNLSNPLLPQRPLGWTSADAAGLPIYPGLVKVEEVKQGVITHAIRFTANYIQSSYAYPASHLITGRE
jgi:hypothetical protein